MYRLRIRSPNDFVSPRAAQISAILVRIERVDNLGA
jgi:hypothetical protein